MDKTVEIVVVAMVALVTGVVILYLATGQAEGFGSFADNQQQNAQCDYWEQTCDVKYEEEGCGTLPPECDSERDYYDQDEANPDTESGDRENRFDTR